MSTKDSIFAVQSYPDPTTGAVTFKTPAEIQDFTNAPDKQKRLNVLWNQNLNGFTEQGMIGNPWNTENTPPTTNYFNPTKDTKEYTTAPIQWSPFPGRLAYNYPSLNDSQLNELADKGNMSQKIAENPCDSSDQKKIPYFPYGPRGWQDEYCEWVVTRDPSTNKITKVQFTCENPEYWNSLWKIDPNKVLNIYKELTGNNTITLEELSLPGVIDPSTSQPAYNPLNKYNTGPDGNTNNGGAIHLTSTPNTLQTEIGLATAATIMRNNPSGSTGNTLWPQRQFNDLLCDAQFGQKNRNSDPNIGGNVNLLVNDNTTSMVSLANPPGLYIQTPNFTNYITPDNSDPSSWWKVIRGTNSIDGLPGDFILHAVFEAPEDSDYVVGDVKIGSENIEWGSQIARTFQMHIIGAAYAGEKGPSYNAVVDKPNPLAQPLQLFYKDVFESMYNTSVPNPVKNPISLLSNSTYIPPTINLGVTLAEMVITTATCNAIAGKQSTYPTVTFNDPAISVEITDVKNDVYYAVPGNSQPSNNTAIFIKVSIGNNATLGVKSIQIINHDQTESTPFPASLVVNPVTVCSYQGWQNTGITIPVGKTAKITYSSGEWTANPNSNGGNLYDASGNPDQIPSKSGYTLPGANEGALIGKIENGTPFNIEDNATTPSGEAGELSLCINDDLNNQYGAGLADNIGEIVVTITIN